jgi:hypothetical protein
MFKPQTREDLQIQMNILKGKHLMLKTRFNKYYEGMKIKNSQDYTDLIHSLRELHKAMAQVSIMWESLILQPSLTMKAYVQEASLLTT